MSNMTESILEKTCLYWLEELGWNILHGPDIAPESPDAERDSYSEVILKDRLRTSLSQINPDVPAVGIDEAVKNCSWQILRTFLSTTGIFTVF